MPHPDHEKNRIAWNEMVDIHVNHMEYRTQEVIDGGSSLKRLELKALGNVKGKSLLHLMCQFGLDTLSWAREGASVTGVDISDMSIKRANELKEKTGLPAEFVRCDVLDLIGVIDKKFDIVYQSYGTHCWISDIFKWAEVVAHYLKPGGTFYIIDGHPIEVLHFDPPVSYFQTEPERTTNYPDYCDRNTLIKSEQVEWQHPVSEIINALIQAGLTIQRVDEYNFGYYRVDEDWYSEEDGQYWYPPGGPTDYPLLLAIKATKS
jgi:SAM-dependent methyltransferase